MLDSHEQQQSGNTSRRKALPPITVQRALHVQTNSSRNRFCYALIVHCSSRVSVLVTAASSPWLWGWCGGCLPHSATLEHIR
jgi:hypothetical protein